MKRSSAIIALTQLFLLAIAIAIAPATPASAAKKTVAGAQTVDAAQAKQLFDSGVTFIDLRSKTKWTKSHIPGAVHLDFRKDFSKAALARHVGKDQPVVFYFDGCRSCVTAIEQAVGWGYAKSHFFPGGMKEWKAQGYPVESAGAPGASAAAPGQDRRANAGQAAAQKAEVFDVVLMDVGVSRVRVIKEVQELTGLTLMEAKNLVDSAPVPIKQGISQNEAYGIKDQLIGAGARISVNGQVFEPALTAPAPSAATSGGGEAAVVQSEFTIILAAFSGDKKVDAIALVREITNLPLIDAKNAVENPPATLKENAPAEEAYRIKDRFVALGATIKLNNLVFGPETNTAPPIAESTLAPAPSSGPAVDQSEFTIVLAAFSGDKKVDAIVLVREITSLPLIDAKNAVENPPATLKEFVPAEEAYRIKDRFVALGATIKLNNLVFGPETSTAPPVAQSTPAPAPSSGPAVDRSEFTIVLTDFSGDKKVDAIVLVREITNLPLMDAKNAVENPPATLKENVPTEEAYRIKEKFEVLGGTVELR